MLGNLGPPWPALTASAAAGVVGAIAGVIIGLPALRLRTFYFAMTTLGLATIITQIALAWQGVTGGGTGVPGPELPYPARRRGGTSGTHRRANRALRQAGRPRERADRQ